MRDALRPHLGKEEHIFHGAELKRRCSYNLFHGAELKLRAD